MSRWNNSDFINQNARLAGPGLGTIATSLSGRISQEPWPRTCAWRTTPTSSFRSLGRRSSGSIVCWRGHRSVTLDSRDTRTGSCTTWTTARMSASETSLVRISHKLNIIKKCLLDNFWDGNKLNLLNQIGTSDWAGSPRVNCLTYPMNDDGILRKNGDNNCKKTTIVSICKKKIGRLSICQSVIVL